MISLTVSTEAFSDRAIGTPTEVSLLLRNVRSGKHEFLILARGPEDYVQTTFGDNAFIVEGRDGSWETHKTASRIAPSTVSSDVPLTGQDVEAIFSAYFDEGDLPKGIRWVSTPEPAPFPIYGVVAVLLGILAVGAFIWWAVT